MTVDTPPEGQPDTPAAGERSLRTDPRADLRMIAALAPFGLDVPPPVAPTTHKSPRQEQLAFCAGIETAFEAFFAALTSGLEPVGGIISETVTIPAPANHEIRLYLHRPAGAAGPLPCVYHIHGGGMVILEAAGPGYTRWRQELAATGLVVVGVEYRNGAGTLGAHPYPAGLDDCVAGLRWAHAHLSELGASHIVVSGESGGANLSLALAIRAKREGWLAEVAGVYAQCPHIADARPDGLARLPSLHENEGYLLNAGMCDVMAEVYDPGAAYAGDPMCWPVVARAADLEGLPPHVISVNELDPLRDAGLVYYRTLLAAGVSTVGRVVLGTCHAGDVFFRGAMPDVYAATIRDISGFAHGVR